MKVFDQILALLKDKEISEIMINGPDEVFFEREGRVKQADFKFESSEQIVKFIKKIAVPTGGRDWNSPIVSARMADGSRVHVVFAPVVLGQGPSVSIRKFLPSRLSLKSLVKSLSLSDEMAYFLNACVAARINIVVSGGTSSGKTSLLNALSTCIDSKDRIVTIEDTAELQLKAKNIVRMECQIAGSDQEVITIRRLLHSSLRMRPDRIIVGETRGEEAFDMLQAMNTGHEGSMTTIHANSPRDCLSRIESMSLLANTGLPLTALRHQISSAVDMVVHMQKLRDGKRKIVSICEVCGMEGDTILSQEIFRYVPMGEAVDKSLLGRFAATGIVPRAMSRFKELGIDFPKDFFAGEYDVNMDVSATQTLPARRLKVSKK